MADFGYVRVSSSDQEAGYQVEALKRAGVKANHIFQDTVSGSVSSRPGLEEVMSRLKGGDTLFLWRLDRLGRSVSHLSMLLNYLDKHGIHIRTLTDGIDTRGTTGKLVFHILSAVAELERETIRERARAGLEFARRHGTKSGKGIGRPRVSSARLQQALELIEGGKSKVQASRMTGISLSTIKRKLKNAN